MESIPRARSCFAISLAAVGALLGSTAAPSAAAGQAPQAQSVTFTKDIAPILQRSCQNCHRPGGGAPMSLVTYEDTRPWARSIKVKTATRDMPPWFIEKNVGIQRFKDDISLNDAEVGTIARWVDAGAPRGNPADEPPPRQFADANTWGIGTPDLIVSSPTILVKAIAGDWHGELDGDSPSGLTEARYVKAIEVREYRPKARSVAFADPVLHHSQVSARAPDGVAIPRESVPVRGAAAADAAPVALPEASVANVNDLLTYLWEVGQNAMIYPDDIGIRLPAGAVFYFPNIHTHSNGTTDVEAQVQVGIKLHPKGYTPKHAAGLTGLSASLVELDFPAGQDHIRYDSYVTIPRPAKMVTYEPHLHTLGTRMCVEALYPNGVRESLNCSRFNYTWMKQYVYEDDAAPLLPAGTIVHITSWYDNSAGNKNNVDPRNWKGLGQRTIDDMFFSLSKVLYMSEQEFTQEVAAREARLKRASHP